MRYRVPRPAVRDGIIYVTEDRKIEGFFETMSIAENIYLGAMAGGPHEIRGCQHERDEGARRRSGSRR